ncbi:MAG: hypothetical protein WAV66_09365 [Anaerolineae bacterium]
MNINDLLQAMLAPRGNQPAGTGTGTNDDPLAGILDGLLGGAGATQQPGAAGDDPLAGILGGLLGGAGGAQQPGAAGDDPLAGILGGLLGGAGGAQQPGSGGLEDILGGLLGGAGATPGVSQTPGSAGAGGLAQVLVQVLGGNREFAGIIEGLAAKIGLPPAVAQMVVTFVLEKLLGGSSTATSTTSSRKRQAAAAAPQTKTGRPRKQTRPDSGALRDMFQQGTRIEPGYLKRSGLASELAQRTGMDSATATQSLDYVFGALQGRTTQMSGESTQVEGLNTPPQGHRRDLPAANR